MTDLPGLLIAIGLIVISLLDFHSPARTAKSEPSDAANQAAARTEAA